MKSKTCDSDDADIASESEHLSFFDNQMSQSLYDDGRATSVMDGSVPSSIIDTSDTTFTMYQEENITTQIDNESSSEGNIYDNKYRPAQTQSPRQWNAKLTTTVVEHDFKQSKFDNSLYVKQSGESFVALIMYVDDIVIIASKPVDIHLPENTILSHIESISDNQHMHNPLQSHMKAALRVLRFLKGSPGLWIQFDKVSDLKLRVFSDADWAKCPKTIKSVTGYIEAEYRSMPFATCETIWLGNILSSLGVTNLYPVDLFCDNNYAIQLAENPIFHEKSKYFEIDVHLVREKHNIFCGKLGIFDMFAGEKSSNGSSGKNLTFSLKGGV
ncbi:ribonuclease H-like domain-containing protein [Tanacetum coccineum]